MKTHVLDAHALLVYFGDEPGCERVAQLLTQATRGEARLLLSLINWGEIAYATMRIRGEEKAEALLQAIDELPIALINADRPLTREAARLKARGGISYADCFAAGLARLKEGDVVTGDPEFEVVEDVVPILCLHVDWDVPGGLGGVGVEQHIMLFGNGADLCDGREGPHLVG